MCVCVCVCVCARARACTNTRVRHEHTRTRAPTTPAGAIADGFVVIGIHKHARTSSLYLNTYCTRANPSAGANVQDEHTELVCHPSFQVKRAGLLVPSSIAGKTRVEVPRGICKNPGDRYLQSKPFSTRADSFLVPPTLHRRHHPGTPQRERHPFETSARATPESRPGKKSEYHRMNNGHFFVRSENGGKNLIMLGAAETSSSAPPRDAATRTASIRDNNINNKR